MAGSDDVILASWLTTIFVIINLSNGRFDLLADHMCVGADLNIFSNYVA